MKTTTFWASCVLLVSMLVGCQQEDLLQSAQEEGKAHQRNQSQSRMVEGLIPFTVDNVQAALPIVLTYYRTNRPIVAEKFAHYQVEATHVYYKFMPQDSIQQARLMEAEDVLQLTTSPLEFSRTERTEDPVEDEVPVYYGIAKYNAAVPDVPHDVIAKLHFTDEDSLEDMQANYDEIEFKQNLMYETRKIAGHLDDEELNEGYMNYEEGIQDKNNGSGAASRLFAKKWRPSGNIRVEEDIVRTNNSSKNHYEGVKRATVNVLKWGWLQVEQGTTDGNGYFSTGTTYTKNVHYKVKFKHDYVTVKEGNFYNTADYFSGEHKRAPLNITFMKDGPLSHYHFFALVHNASYDYYNRCLSKFGLHNPGKLNITALYYGSNSNSGAQWYPFNSAIRVSRSSSGFYRGSDGIYATTVHELTHNSQRKMDPGMFSLLYTGNKQRKLMIESWAEGVETIVTNDRYTSMFSSNGYGVYRSSTRGTHASTLVWNGLRQHQSISDMNAYTPLVIDLVDNFNQSQVLNNPNIPNERVYGYTLAQIQTALNTSRTLDQWKGRLESLYSNSTEPMLGDVFGYAQTVLSNSANWTD